MIRDKKGSENVVANHMSRLVNEEVTSKEAEVRDEFPDESLFVVSERPWFSDMANFKAAGSIPKDLNWQQRKKFLHDAQLYTWCHTLISSGDLCLMTCDLSLVLVRCLASNIRQFVKFQDMPKNQKILMHNP